MSIARRAVTRRVRWMVALLLALTVGVAIVHASDARRRASDNIVFAGPASAEDIKAEIRFGREVGARVLGRHALEDHTALTRYVNLVGRGLALNSARPELEFYFGVVRSDAINAYATPGGYVFVTTAALHVMQDEAELAAVLAHEIAHVTERHIVRALKIRGAAASPEALLAQIVGSVGDPARTALQLAVDQALEILFDRGLDKENELDADRYATLMLVNSGYDPQALKRYLTRVRGLRADATAEVSRTHPSFSERLLHLKAVLARDGVGEMQLTKARTRFATNTKNLGENP